VFDWPSHAVDHLVSVWGGEPPNILLPYDCNACDAQVTHGTWEAIFCHVLEHIRSGGGGRRLAAEICLLSFLRDHDIISEEERRKAVFQSTTNHENRAYTHLLSGMGAGGHHMPLKRGKSHNF
jgi:hypothetical protein